MAVWRTATRLQGVNRVAEDPYEVLGVPRTASEADIRKAYRKLAKQWHPDLNPGDATAEARFKAVGAAYEILGDPETRARFDRGEIDATGAERHDETYYRHYADADRAGRYTSTAGFEDLGGMSDFFADLFGGGEHGTGRARFRARGSDVAYRLEVDFLDAAKGARRRITLPDGKALDVTIPAGIRDGATLRLKGKGEPGLGGGPDGDALIEISVRPHPLFVREGDDIRIDLPIAIDEAVLGAKVVVPTIGGSVKVTVPPGSSSGDVLRLKGRGVAPKDRPAGNQLVRLQVVLPETVDAELTDFMRTWRERHAYDPRTEMTRAAS